MIPFQVLGLIVACGLAATLAVLLDNRDLRRAHAGRDTLTGHRVAVRTRLYDQDEHQETAA